MVARFRETGLLYLGTNVEIMETWIGIIHTENSRTVYFSNGWQYSCVTYAKEIVKSFALWKDNGSTIVAVFKFKYPQIVAHDEKNIHWLDI